MTNVSKRLLNEEAGRGTSDSPPNETALKAHTGNSHSKGTRRERTCYNARNSVILRECVPRPQERKKIQRGYLRSMLLTEIPTVWIEGHTIRPGIRCVILCGSAL